MQKAFKSKEGQTAQDNKLCQDTTKQRREPISSEGDFAASLIGKQLKIFYKLISRALVNDFWQ